VLWDKWNLNIFSQYNNTQQSRRLYFTTNFYVNICKIEIVKNNETTAIELIIQNYMEDIQNLDNEAMIMYIFALVDYQWEPYFFGLDTINWRRAQW
jgi:hypothetical protein